MQSRPWSANQLKKLGASIKTGDPLPPNVPTFDEVIVWYNELASYVQQRIEEQDWTPLLEDRIPEITSRAKTIDTLREKLQRNSGSKLGTIQDLAGVRFEAEMTLQEQDGVANAIAQLFDHRAEPPCLKDLRIEPHSGYRAVHLWLHLQGPVEVQIRTHLQGEWANMYEAAGDFFGRHIRYDELTDDSEATRLINGLQEISTGRISSLEETRQMIQTLELELSETKEISSFRVSSEKRRLYRDREVRKTRLIELKTRYVEAENGVRLGMSSLRTALTAAEAGE